jgi:biotin carboxyl carrier protein
MEAVRDRTLRAFKHFGAVFANLLLIGLACAVLGVSPAPGPKRVAAAAPEPSQPTQLRLASRLLPRAKIEVRTSRHAEVIEVAASVGDGVIEGQALIVLRDLALVEKLAEVRAEVTRLQAGIVETLAHASSVEQAESRARLATVRQIEADYEAELQDFERLRKLFDEGLLARVEYEQHQRDLEMSRVEAETARESIDRPSTPDAPRAIDGLASAHRMLERLEALPDQFILTAPQDAVVEDIFVSSGDSPERGSVLMLLRENSRPRLIANLPAGVRAAGVIEVCGKPGQFEFEIVDETLLVDVRQFDESFKQPCDIVIERAE